MSLRFSYPRDLRFTCSLCGDCCRDSNIVVEPHERVVLEGLDWSGSEPDTAPADTVVELGNGAMRLARRDDGTCVYLDEDDRCRIHETFGAEAKPRMCRLFPFAFHPVADRIGVDVAFSCRTVGEGPLTGKPGASLEHQEAVWRELIEKELGDPRPLEHRVSAKYLIEGPLLDEMESHLLELLGNRSLSLFDRVRCLRQYARLAATGDPGTDAASMLRQAMVNGLPKQIIAMQWAGQMDDTQRAIFYQWLYLALNPSTANQDLLDGSALKAEQKRRVEEGNRYQHVTAHPVVDNESLACTFETVAEVDATPIEAEFAPIVVSYLRAKILGHRYLQAPGELLPFVEALPKFLLVYPMTIWTAQALAAHREMPKVGGDRPSPCAASDRPLTRPAVDFGPAPQAGQGLRLRHARHRFRGGGA